MRTLLAFALSCALGTLGLRAQVCVGVNLISNGLSTQVGCVPKPISFTADSGRWNVVAASSGAGHDYDIAVTGAGTSSFNGAQCDFLIASGHQGSGLGATNGTLTRVSGTGTVDCDVQFVSATTMSLGTITVDWSENRIVQLVEFEITSPAFYDITVNGDADVDFRVYSPPANTAWQTRSAAVELAQGNVGQNTVNSVALGIGWHAVVISRDGGPEGNPQTTIDTVAITVCPAAAAVVLAENTPIDLQPSCGEFSITPVQDRYNVVAIASAANWNLAIGEAISDFGSNSCDFAIMREGAGSPATAGVPFTTSGTGAKIEFDAADPIPAGGAGSFPTGTLGSQEVVAVHELTLNLLGDIHVGVFGGNGDSNFRWSLFADLPDGVWVRRAQALTNQPVGGPPVLNLAVGTGNHDLAIVIFRSSGAPSGNADYHIVVHDGFSNTLIVPDDGTAVSNSSFPGETVIPFVLQGPAAGRWNAVAIQQPFAGPDPNLFLGAAASREPGTVIDWAVADGHQGGTTPISGLAAPGGVFGTEDINVKHFVAQAIPPGGTGTVSFNSSAPQNQRPFFQLFELESGGSGTGTIQVTTSSANVLARFLLPAAHSRWSPRSGGTPVTSTQPLTQSFSVGPGFHALAVWHDELSTPFTTVTVTWTAPAPVPVLISISPATRNCGSGSFTITANGSGFVPFSEVQWNGGGLATTFVSPTQITATVPAVFLTAPATASIGVFTPAPGGGTSSALTFTVAGGTLPVVVQVLPPVVPSGFGGNLAVQGLGVVPGASVRLNGNLLAATFSPPPTAGAPATLQAVYLSSHLPACGGTVPVTIVNPGTCGGESAPGSLVVVNPTPVLTSISPSTTGSTTSTAGSTTLTATGSNFRACSVVEWDGAALATTFVSATQLTASVPVSLFGCAGTRTVRVNTPAPGGGLSAAIMFTITNPVPILTTVNPTTLASTTGSTPAALALTGNNFRSCSVVEWNGTALATTFNSQTSLSASVPASLLSCGGTASVRVSSPAPGGGLSAAVTVTVTNPVPALTSVTPTTLNSTTGAAGTTITVAGSNFRSCSVVQWNGSNLTTTFISASSLSANVPGSLLACGGTASVRVSNPAPGGGLSAVVTVTINNPVPGLASISPPTLASTTGPAGATLTISGLNFRACSVVQWDGADLATTFVSAISLSAAVPSSLLACGSTAAIRVRNPSPGGGVSPGLPLIVTNPVPVLSSISPAAGAAGGPAFFITANGSSFRSCSVIRWNGLSLATTFVSSSQIRAIVPTGLVAAPGTALVTVFNPPASGGTSASRTYTIQAPAITSISPASIPVLAAGGSATVLVTGTGFVAATARVSANGILLVPGPASATTLTVQISAAQVLQATRPGAIALTVQNAAPDAVSNTVALMVDGGTGGNNEGTIRRHPLAVAPGQAYAALLEGGAPNAVFSLYADAENPPPLTAWPDAAGNLVLAVGPLVSSGALFFPVIEGLGIFGPASGATLDSQGAFLLPGFVAPNPPLGVDVTVQAVYLDATAPLGFNLTWARWPDSL